MVNPQNFNTALQKLQVSKLVLTSMSYNTSFNKYYHRLKNVSRERSAKIVEDKNSARSIPSKISDFCFYYKAFRGLAIVQRFKHCHPLALILVNKYHQLLRIYTFDNDEKKKR